MINHFFKSFALMVLFYALLHHEVNSVSPGIPLAEDFSDQTLNDNSVTLSNWSTRRQALILPFQARRILNLPDDNANISAFIGAETDTTSSIAFGDVDGDGDLDIVAGNNGSTNKLYLNDGAGGFSASGTAIGSETDTTTSLVLANIDEDSDLDLIVGNAGQTNKVYFNNGSGTFSTTGIALGSETDTTQGIILVDIDKDGDLDAIAANAGQTNKVYTNDGGGSFSSTGTNLGSETDQSMALGAADLDKDGDPDIIVGNDGQTNKFYSNDGSGNFSATGTDIGSESDSTLAISAGDIDNDGDLDVISSNFGQSNKSYLNSSGTFSATGVDVGSTTNNNQVLHLFDLDKDADLDVITEDNGQMVVYLNTGDGSFSSAARAVGAGTDLNTVSGLAIADFDHNGEADLVMGTDDQNAIYYAQGNGGFSATGRNFEPSVTNLVDTHQIILVDVDNDGDLDIVADNDAASNELYLNDGEANFTNLSGIGGNLTQAITMGDVDGDGFDDGLVANNGQNIIQFNDGSGGFAGTGLSLGIETDDSTAIAVGDVDHDGDQDAMVGNDGQTNKIYLNNGSGSFADTGIDVGSEVESTQAIVFAKLNANSTRYLVVANDGQNRIYDISDLTATLTPLDLGTETDTTRALAVADVDNDGDLDIITGNNSQTNKLYINGGSNDWSNAGIAIGIDTDNTYSVDLIDVDSDGDVDLVVGNNGQENKIHYNDGAGNFASNAMIISSATNETHSIRLGDLDNDGDFDAVIGNFSQENKIHFNDSEGFYGLISDFAQDENDAPLDLKTADFNRDGFLDIVSAVNGGENKLYLNDGEGYFPTSGSVIDTDVGVTESLAIADVDSDGDLDVAFGYIGAQDKVYFNDGDGNFSLNQQLGGNSRDLALVDIDQDGIVDLLSGNTGINLIFYGNASGTFITPGNDIGAESDDSKSIQLADIDGDGGLDLIVGNNGATNKLYLYDGEGGYTNGFTNIGSETDATESIAVYDFDNDGDLDIVAINADATNKFYENTGSGSFPATGTDLSAEILLEEDAKVIDVDHDGDLDILTSNSKNVYLNDGAANFSLRGMFGLGLTADNQTIEVADFDQDGDYDLIGGLKDDINFYDQLVNFRTHAGLTASIEVSDGDTDISGVLLVADDDANEAFTRNTAVRYFVSNDGGSRWYEARSGVNFYFPDRGSDDLRWRAELKSLSPVLTPTVNSIDLDIVNHWPNLQMPSLPSVNEDDINVAINDDVEITDQDNDDQTVTITVEGGTVSLDTTGLSFNSGDGSDDATMEFTATLADVNNALDSLTFTPDTDLNGTNAASITIDTDDIAFDSGTIQFDIQAINDDPSNDGSLPPDLTFTEDIQSDVDLSSMLLSDVDIDGNDLTLTLSVGAGTLSASAAGGVNVLGSDSDTLILEGDIDDINSYLSTASNIQYLGDLHLEGDDITSLNITANDGGNSGSGGGFDVDLGSVNIDISAVNDDPIVVGSLPSDFSFDEDINGDVDLSSITITDVDAATNTIQLELIVTEGQLSASTSGGVSVSGSGSDTLMLAGDISSLNAYLSVSTNIQYLGALDANGDDVATLDVTVNDGGNVGSGGGSDILVGSANIDINAINDDPVNNGNLAGDIVFIEDTIDDLDLSALSLDDIDSENSVIAVTVAVGQGTLTALSDASVTVTGSGSSSLILSGTVSDIDGFFDVASNVQYQGAVNSNGDNVTTLTIIANDGGSSGSGGGTDVVLAVSNIDITAVNDDPFSGTSLITSADYDEDIIDNLDLSSLDLTDIDAGSNAVLLVITTGSGYLSAANNGTVSVTGSGSDALSLSGTIADLNTYLDDPTSIQYQGENNLYGDDLTTIEVTINDGGNVGLGGGADVNLGSISVNISPVNDLPENAGDPLTTLTFTEDLEGNIDLSGLDIVDVDVFDNALRLTLNVSAGTLNAAGSDTVQINGTNSDTIMIEGTLTALNAYIDNSDNLHYLPAANAYGSEAAELTITINDFGQSGAGTAMEELLASAFIDINPVDDPPVLSGTPDAEVLAASGYEFTPELTDVDSSAFTFTVSNLPSWASFDESTGALSGTPEAEDIGSYEQISISVSDANNMSSLEPFTVTVIASNQAPSIEGDPSLIVENNGVYSFTPIASDPNDDALSFSVTGLPEWLEFDPETGTVSGNPSQLGEDNVSEPITITVTDGEFSASLEPFTVTVEAPLEEDGLELGSFNTSLLLLLLLSMYSKCTTCRVNFRKG